MGYTDMIKRTLLLLLASMVMVSTAIAQDQSLTEETRTVSSAVTDLDGNPLPGVSVKAIGSQKETFTNANGEFSIEVLSGNDKLSIAENGFKEVVVDLDDDLATAAAIRLQDQYIFDGASRVHIPYGSMSRDRSVSAIASISGEELIGYPGSNVMEALKGRIPGLVVNIGNRMPGFESVSMTVRGSAVRVYIDGVERDPTYLTPFEIDHIYLIKDFSARASLGVSGADHIMYITTKHGVEGGRINVNAEYGVNSPTYMPEFVDAYTYATLHNEARANDGQTPIYSQADLDAYQDGSSPALHPDIDWYDTYVSDFSSFRRVNLDFADRSETVAYYALLDYVGSGGLENVGQTINSDQFRARGKIAFPFNDWIDIGVNVLGSYQAMNMPNQGGGAQPYNMFSNVLSSYPANAHPIMVDGSLVSNQQDYPINIHNDLIHGGRSERSVVSSNADGIVNMDLSRFLEGLTLSTIFTFDIYSNIGIGRGGSEELFNILPDGSLDRWQEREVDPDMGLGLQQQNTRTQATARLHYERTFAEDHSLIMNGSFYRGYFEGQDYQPEQFMDYSVRANYSYLNRYILQLDVAHSGSMRLPSGERFNTYPTVGLGWIASNEDFLSDVDAISFLKVFGSYGILGINNFEVGGYNNHYLHRTSWQTAGDRGFGIPGSGSSNPVTVLNQIGATDFNLPERHFLNVGLQTNLFENSISFEVNYFEEKNSGILSTGTSVTPGVIGAGSFAPVQNLEENRRYGFDGMIQFRGQAGDFGYQIGANALYQRAEYLVVDEPASLPNYRKFAGTDMDLYRIYEADGLFQDQGEIDSHVSQSWGDLQPGDIRYVDVNEDGVVDQQDVYAPGAHSPRFFYGVNLSLNYGNFGLKIFGDGVADGQVMLSSNRMFRHTSANQNYSMFMLDRFPETNNVPRLTHSSDNNVQNSTFWLRDANYFRISNAELSYSIPQSITEMTPASGLTVFVRGRNLLTFSEMTDHNLDPVNLNAGITQYPVLRTITAGIGLQF